MKKNLRPGYLAGFQGLTPKTTRIKRAKIRSGLGAFGKGAFVPIPGAPPGSLPMEDAINKSTGKIYMQDPRCPEGEKMVTTMTPCQCGPTWPKDPNGCPECCDGGDCDPIGTPYPENECEDDPNYQQVIPQPPKVVAPTTAQQEELLQLAQEAEQAETIVTAPAALAPPGAYTGSPPPAYTPPQTKTPDEQQQIMALVEEYQMERLPAARPRPVARVAPSRPAPRPAIPDLLGWLKNALFGSGNGMEGWTDSKLCKYGVPTIALVIVAYMVLKDRK